MIIKFRPHGCSVLIISYKKYPTQSLHRLVTKNYRFTLGRSGLYDRSTDTTSITRKLFLSFSIAPVRSIQIVDLLTHFILLFFQSSKSISLSKCSWLKGHKMTSRPIIIYQGIFVHCSRV